MPFTVRDYAELLERMKTTIDASKPKGIPIIPWFGREVITHFNERTEFIHAIDVGAELWFESLSRVRDVLLRNGAPEDGYLQFMGFTMVPQLDVVGRDGELVAVGTSRLRPFLRGQASGFWLATCHACRSPTRLRSSDRRGDARTRRRRLSDVTDVPRRSDRVSRRADRR